MNNLIQIQYRLEYLRQMNGSLSESRKIFEMVTIDELLSNISNESIKESYELMVDQTYESVGIGRY